MEDVFIPKNECPESGLTLGLLLQRTAVKGEVGIEIEVEGKRLPHEDTTPSPWRYHPDGSLRGEDNGEYVLAAPLSFAEVPAALDNLWEVFKEKKSRLDDSNRTSVHVHLNCQSWYLNRLAAFLGLYYTLEECLTAWCGEHREGNLFCLRGIDAPGTVTYFKKFIQTGGEYPLSEALHYAAMNPAALKKFGSLEVRTLRGCSDKEIIQTWVSVLERLYKLSEDFSDPREVCTMISGMGTLEWFESVLGDKAAVIREGIPFTEHDIDTSLKTGIRLAQDLCYCRDWSMYSPLELKPDPFRRPVKKLIKRLRLQGTTPSDFMAYDAAGPNVSITALPHNSPFTVNALIDTAEPEEPDYPPDWDDEDDE